MADPGQLIFETRIDGRPVGSASAAALPGGPLEALRFVLGHLAERGRSLCAGQWVSTGAITGVHQIFPGQHGSIELIGHGLVKLTFPKLSTLPVILPSLLETAPLRMMK